jgi:GNAT acetyltransferase-like protein
MNVLPEMVATELVVPPSGGVARSPVKGSFAATPAEAQAPGASSQELVKRFVAIDPLEYPAWDSLLAVRPGSSFFHGSAWARVLHETYGHRPVYFCRFADGQLEEMLPIMEVSSLWKGRRGVSLPFTDVCLPLNPAKQDQAELYELAMQRGQARTWRYLECRGSDYGWSSARPSLAFYGHAIDLGTGEKALFSALDGAVRRGIRKAQNARLQVEFCTNLESVRTFYALHCQTRRRHGLPPQPFAFFENIARHVLSKGHGFAAIARLEQRPVAAAIFFHQGRGTIYKFGASDYAFQHLRPNNLLMWEAIKRYAASGYEQMHMGRTSIANEGLRRFKLGFGAREEKISYYKYDFVMRAFVTGVDRAEGWFNRLFRLLPPPLLRLAGELLYPQLS